MSGIFTKPSTPSYTPPPAPSAPIEEALFKAGESEITNPTKLKKKGKSSLMIPMSTTTTAPTTTGLGIGV